MSRTIAVTTKFNEEEYRNLTNESSLCGMSRQELIRAKFRRVQIVPMPSERQEEDSLALSQLIGEVYTSLREQEAEGRDTGKLFDALQVLSGKVEEFLMAEYCGCQEFN